MRRLRAEDGLTLIEVLAAIFILTVGVVGMISGFDTTRRLTLVSERRQSITHLGQRELERLQSVPYEQLAMASVPTHSSESTNPDYYFDYSSPVKCKEAEKGGCLAWNSEKLTEEEPLVISTKGGCTSTSTSEEVCGKIYPSPVGRPCAENPVGSCEWTDGRLSGYIYDFITWHTDGESGKKYCGSECPAENDYKRATVIVTVNVPKGSHALTPVRFSTLIANTKESKKNPLDSPGTKCGESGTEECTSGIGKGNAQSWFLHDSTAESNEEKPVTPTASHPTHATVAPTNVTSCTSSDHSGCSKPDLMDANSPKAEKLWDYSTDQSSLGATMSLEGGLCKGIEEGSKCYGGRLLIPDVSCAESTTPSPTEDNSRGEFWVTTPLTAKTTLTGAGGLTLYTQTLGGTAASAALCVGIYEVPKSIANLSKTGAPPTLIAHTSFSLTSWPTSMTSESFVFKLEFLTSNHAIESERRIGLRVWPATSSTDDLAIAYDTASQPSILQLNTE